jgi:gliding motility-associated-like protein
MSHSFYAKLSSLKKPVFRYKKSYEEGNAYFVINFPPCFSPFFYLCVSFNLIDVNMPSRNLILLFIIFPWMVTWGQTILYSATFEPPFSEWTVFGGGSPNTFIRNSCAGNGPSASGTNALYISKGGTVSGCGATGTEQFAYGNAAASTQEVIAYTTVNASCATNLQAIFDYRIQGVSNEDVGQLVFSTDNGATWNQQGADFTSSANWTTTTSTLPLSLNNASFLVGVRFVSNNAGVNGFPLAIDNFRITGSETQAPVITTCPGNVNLPVNSSCQATLPDYSGQLVATDNCPGSLQITQSPLAGTFLSGSGNSSIVTMTVTDGSNNSTQCNFTVTLSDTTRPVFVCPANQSVSKNAQCQAFIPDFVGLISPTDNCTPSGTIQVVQNPLPGTALLAATSITLTATDLAGNSRTCSFFAFPVDNTSPSLSCPPNQTVSTNSGCNYTMASWGTQATLSDNCSANNNMVFTQSPIVGSSHPIGTVTVTLNVTDQVGNPATCNFQLTIADLVSPVLVCPSNQSVILNNSCSGSVANYGSLVTITDNCSPLPTLVLTQQPVAGTSLSMDTPITITGTDVAGNQGTCTFTALAVDTIDPVISCPDTVFVPINAACSYTVPDIATQLTLNDNCISMANLAVIQAPVPGSIATGTTIVNATAFDQQGNNATCTLTLAPIDIAAPSLVCPNPPTVLNGVNCSFVLNDFTPAVLVTDNCPTYVLSQNPAPGSVLTNGVTNVVIEVTDAGGNTNQCSFNLNITESIPPQITCPPNVSTCDSVIFFTLPSYSDNCEVSLVQTDGSGLTSGSVFPVGLTPISYEAIDSSGNATGCSFLVERLASPSPAIISLDTLYLCDVTSGVVQAQAVTFGTGSWSLVSGIATFNNPFANLTGVNNLLSDTVIVAWTVTTPSCGISSDTLIIIISDSPLPTETLDTLYACSDAVVNLFGDAPLIGNGAWSTNSGASIVDPSSPISEASNFAYGWSEFIWTVSNGSCLEQSDTLHLFSSIDTDILTSDTVLCLGLSLEIEGLPLIDQQESTWSFYNGVGSISAPFESTTTVSGMQLGTSTLIYEVAHPECEAIADTLTLVVSLCEGLNPILPTVFTPNSDGENDIFVINSLEKVYPDLRVTIFNRWGNMVFESIGYDEPWNGTRKGEELPAGVYFYKLELMDGENSVLNGSISLIR